MTGAAWLLVLACAAQTLPAPSPAPVPAPPAPEEPVAEPALTERLRVPLRHGQTHPLEALGGEVVFVGGKVSAVRTADGRFVERGTGTLRFVRGDEATEVAFEEGRVFEQWGYRMAVFGGAGSFELSVFPEGEPAKP